MHTTIPLHNIPTITTTLPDGRVMSDTRPGHSVSGLMNYLDPFIRYHGIRMRHLAMMPRFA